MLDSDEIREIYRSTQIVRKPTYGIVSGYHELPYICLGESFELGRATTEVRGKVQVSPRFIIRPPQSEPSYDEIFGSEYVDHALAGRMFGFYGFRERPVECKSEHLVLKHTDVNIDKAIAEALDELERHEDITTGVIITPNSHYFPVSIERFIASVLEDEFTV